jgi:long-chain acyl-CoA synthetase
MDYDRAASLTAMFFEQAARYGDKPFLWAKRGSEWRSLSWSETATQVRRLALGLLELGLSPGDRVMLISENRPEWLIADLAIMAAGAVTVPAYTTNTIPDHLHLMSNSGAKLAIVSTRTLAERVIGAARLAQPAPMLITIEPLDLRQSQGLDIKNWDDVLALGAGDIHRIDDRVKAVARSDLACLIYTSGTGGTPKGVMLSHGGIISNCKGAHHVLETVGLGEEVFLSFLPLSHSYEHTAGQFFPISIGAQIHYCGGVDQLSGDMAQVRPTIMTAVPRLYELMRARILQAIARDGGVKARLFARAVHLGSRTIERNPPLTLFEYLENRLLDLLVRRKVAKRFGGRLKAMVSGGAPLNYEVGLFFAALKVPIFQGYGQTEASPVISCNLPDDVRLEAVGRPMLDVEVKIAPDGEILVKGELVMLGYWRDPAATALAIQDGWLHTGDIGTMDADGTLRITDRKKDIIVNSGGDNLSPQRVEGFLTLTPEIAQAMVYGDRRPHLVALLVPDQDHAQNWAAQRGKSGALADLAADADFRAHIGETVDRVNTQLSVIEKVRRFVILPEPFTVANEMITPTLKIRRHAILARYEKDVVALYDERR